MPELPEVETVRRGLLPVLEGAVIARAEVNRPDLRWPLPIGMADRLTGEMGRLRGLTLGELRHGGGRRLVFKEGLLGLLNGALVGVSAALGMYVVARSQGNPSALLLSLVVFLAMIGSCVVSGLAGALIPLTLKRVGADPATASSIFLTTATDVASMGLFLGLATLIVL